MIEHLAKVVAIHPSAARRTSIKMSFGQVAHAHAMANVPPARKLNDRAVPFCHVGSRKPRRRHSSGRKGLQPSILDPLTYTDLTAMGNKVHVSIGGMRRQKKKPRTEAGLKF
jgi:hypothetical protein